MGRLVFAGFDSPPVLEGACAGLCATLTPASRVDVRTPRDFLRSRRGTRLAQPFDVLTLRRGIALVLASLLPLISSLPLLVTSGCGGETQGEPTPGLPDGSVRLWNDGTPDAAPHFVPDPGSVGPSSDAALPVHADPDPLAHCGPLTRDAFYVNVLGIVTGPVGAYLPGSETFTNQDSYFSLFVECGGSVIARS
jgi:hypothetical protein